MPRHFLVQIAPAKATHIAWGRAGPGPPLNSANVMANQTTECHGLSRADLLTEQIDPASTSLSCRMTAQSPRTHPCLCLPLAWSAVNPTSDLPTEAVTRKTSGFRHIRRQPSLPRASRSTAHCNCNTEARNAENRNYREEGT
jgi:hypothetical protein